MIKKAKKPYKARTTNSLFYRNKYLIALYDINDYPVDVYDNVVPMAKALNKGINTMYAILTRAFQKWTKGDCLYQLIIDGKKCNVHFIEMEEEEC